MIYDTFLYDGEEEMLRLRLETLKDVVDEFIMVDGHRTFRGKVKPPFAGFDTPTKILEGIEIEDETHPFSRLKRRQLVLPPFQDPWLSEHWHRNFVLHSLPNLKPDDIVLVGDVDEIPDPGNVAKLGVHSMEFFQYNQNWSKKKKWLGTCSVTGKYILEGNLPSMIRMERDQYHVIEGGWHLAYFFMDAIRIREKIRSFSHKEFDKPEFTDLESIQTRMNQGLDLFDRGEQEDCLFVQSGYLPPALRASPVVAG